jgi:3-isopropylmalate/(R)-2-methylmalate dehydratase small subunit
MDPLIAFEGRAVVLNRDHIDTDQIIPARFLTTAVKEGLGDKLFHGWRYEADGVSRPDFPLNDPEAAGATILVTGDNFGCGSSREHAPWALLQFGFRAVVSTSFADIFRQNALKNRLLPIAISKPDHARLLAFLACHPSALLTVDLVARLLRVPDGFDIPFPIDEFSRQCLLGGIDEIGYVLRQDEAICMYESSRPSHGTPALCLTTRL